MSDATALAQQANTLTAEALALQVTDAPTYERAAEMVKTAATFIKRVHEFCDPTCQATDQAHTVAVAQRKSLLEPAEGIKRVLGVRMGAWDEEQARLRREAEAAMARERERLEREAREAAAAEQRRLQAEAETRRLEEAAALEARGDTKAAERLIEQPVAVPIVTPAPVFMPTPPAVAAAPKVAGISYGEVWDFEVTDEALVPREYLMLDDVKIGRVVRAMKGSTNIPGIKAVRGRSQRVRA